MSTISSWNPRIRKVRAPVVTVQQVVEDVGVDLDSHVPASCFETACCAGRRCQRGGANQHDLVAKGIRRHSAAEHVPHGIVR